jgi:superoxide dismutase, Cu-Zn family
LRAHLFPTFCKANLAQAIAVEFLGEDGYLLKEEMTTILIAFAVAGVLAGCAGGPMPERPVARAQLQPTQGNTAAGLVTFTQRGDRVRIEANFSGLKPNSEHGFHVHEKGDCSAPDAASAGEHFNPAGNRHAHYDSKVRHAGDIPNLKADSQGNARYSWETDLLLMSVGAQGMLGRSVVVHRDPDDYVSQPAGASGPRIACGVIRPV